jgi:hypothetical protein
LFEKVSQDHACVKAGIATVVPRVKVSIFRASKASDSKKFFETEERLAKNGKVF